MIERLEVLVDHPVPGGHTNAYVVGDPSILIDPVAGPDIVGVDPADVDHIAVTHTHPDHAAGVEPFAEAADALVWASAPHRARFRERTGVEPDRTFRDGELIGNTGIQVMACPGHSPDHVSFFTDRAALIGDMARRDGSVMVGVPDGDMRAYFSTLRRLLTREIETAYPGHGPPITDPASRFAALLAHRLDRERRIEAAVAAGSTDVSEIVDRAYDKDLTGVETAAARTVRAHLEKLAVEGRVSWDGSRATPS